MTRPFQQWTALPHGKLVEVDESILTVVGKFHMPLMDLPRRMTVVRLADGRLVMFSAIALGGDERAALEAYGRPAFFRRPERAVRDRPWNARPGVRTCRSQTERHDARAQ
jgi:hypothetical protein